MKLTQFIPQVWEILFVTLKYVLNYGHDDHEIYENERQYFSEH